MVVLYLYYIGKDENQYWKNTFRKVRYKEKGAMLLYGYM
jgi:hypothetical protein